MRSAPCLQGYSRIAFATSARASPESLSPRDSRYATTNAVSVDEPALRVLLNGGRSFGGAQLTDADIPCSQTQRRATSSYQRKRPGRVGQPERTGTCQRSLTASVRQVSTSERAHGSTERWDTECCRQRQDPGDPYRDVPRTFESQDTLKTLSPSKNSPTSRYIEEIVEKLWSYCKESEGAGQVDLG